MSSTAQQITKYKFEWARAIANDDWRSIEDQIDKGLNVNRGPILHTAIQQKRFVIARKFIENGADVNKENKRGKTPLQILIENHRQNPPRKGKGGRSTATDRRRRNHNGSGDTTHESRANGIISSQERILAFGRYLMQEGAKPISGPNEGDDYHLYQEFYKRKTKLTKDDFARLKKIIDACNVEALENELDSSVTVQCIGPNDQECLGRGLLHLAVLAPCYKIIKLLLEKGADPNCEDKNGATPLYLVFHPIEYKERHKYKDEKNIPKALLCWQDIDSGNPRDPKKPGRNDVLVQIGQALLQAGAHFVPDHTPELDKRAFHENYPNCPLIIFWHLYSKGSESNRDVGNDPIILNMERNRSWRRNQNKENRRKKL